MKGPISNAENTEKNRSEVPNPSVSIAEDQGMCRVSATEQ